MKEMEPKAPRRAKLRPKPASAPQPNAKKRRGALNAATEPLPQFADSQLASPQPETGTAENAVSAPPSDLPPAGRQPAMAAVVPGIAPTGALLRVFEHNPFETFSLQQLRSFLAEDSFELDDTLLLAELDTLTRSGLVEPRDGKWRARLAGRQFEGPVRFFWRDNYAEVSVPELAQPIVLQEAKRLDCLPEDVVLVTVTRVGHGRVAGELVMVLKRTRTEFVGTIAHGGSSNYFVPQDQFLKQDFVVPNDRLLGAQDGQKVRARVIGFKNGRPRAEVIEIIGESGKHEVEMHAIIAEYRLDTQFTKEALAEAEAIPEAIPAKEIDARRDFRSIATFTIDPVDAKDFDDALSFERLAEGNFRIGVHIADVSHYVLPGTALDADAFARATSVYLVDRTLPMLPEKISNNLCSLVPHQDRLAYAAVFEVAADGRVLDEWFGRTVIHSDRRFSYEQVQAILDAGNGEYHEILDTLNKIAYKLREDRFAKGSIGFETEEVRFRLDENGVPTEVYVKERLDAHKLIEDFMLLANRRVAAHVANKRKKPPVPFPYRVHPMPTPEKIVALQEFVARFGHQFEVEEDKPESISVALNQLATLVQGRPEQNIVQQMSIRSMSKAYYTTSNDGHYGLGFQFYCHFTSPIRRYPDVLAHRVLDDVLHDRHTPDRASLETMCKHSSDREKLAADAERASTKYKMAEYIARCIGEAFEGTIVGLTDWGMYVELTGSRIEGMIWTQDIAGDSFQLDEKGHSLMGRRSGLRLYLGDRVRIRVKKVNVLKRQIDFDFVERLGGMAHNPDDNFSPRMEMRGGGQARNRKARGGQSGAPQGQKPKGGAFAIFADKKSKGKKRRG